MLEKDQNNRSDSKKLLEILDLRHHDMLDEFLFNE